MSETHLRLLRLLQDKPELSQRDLARATGTSLGKINFCLNALVKKGLIKVRNFRGSQNKLGYAYLLTPKGIEVKASITLQFLRRKLAEFDALKTAIALLKDELAETEPKDRG